jgi:hypothetical protein
VKAHRLRHHSIARQDEASAEILDVPGDDFLSRVDLLATLLECLLSDRLQ